MFRMLNFLFLCPTKLVLGCLVFFSSTALLAQESIDLSIGWKTPLPVEVNGFNVNEPQIEGQNAERGCITFVHKKRVKYTNANLTLTILEEELAPNEDINYLNAIRCEITDSVSYQLKVTSARNEHFLVFSLNPYVKRNGVIKRITKLTIQSSPTAAPVKEKSFASNSVLRVGTGEWYKIKVSQDGIYKIDQAFLQSCGIQTSGLNPQHIHIYGNGDGRLPELNSAPRTDD